MLLCIKIVTFVADQLLTNIYKPNTTMDNELKIDGDFSYWEKGKGQPLILLHGLMGDLKNFQEVYTYFSNEGYQVLIPALPIYTMPIIKTNIKNLAKFLKNFIEHKGLKEIVLFGNSLGGHVALYFTKYYPEYVKALVLAGSSGLYEQSLGNTYPRRGDRVYIKKKIEEVFYDPKTADPELVETIMDLINDRGKVIRTLALAKSAIRHNMGVDLPTMNLPTCLIWGKYDKITPPKVADEFHELLPDSDLFWVDKCGHAPMWERPNIFNKILHDWFKKRDI